MKNLKKIYNKIKFKRINITNQSQTKHKFLKKKIHRRYIPKISCRIPKGIASHLVARVSSHNWHYNNDLINLRRSLGMRIHARSELCETLTILSSVLIIYCNYSLHSEYLFEISAPFEIIAHSMNMLHVYKDGRKSYDPPLNALRILEKLKYLIIFRDRNPDTGYCKPLRIWLTSKFFTSRGITIQQLRLNLIRFENWAIRKNLVHTLISNKEKHLLKMRVIGIDLLKFPSLRNLLTKIKKNILGYSLYNKISDNFNHQYINKNLSFLNDTPLDKHQKIHFENTINHILINKLRPSNFWYCKFVNWSLTKMPYQIILLEKNLRAEKPNLMNTNSEKYYKTLIKRGKNII